MSIWYKPYTIQSLKKAFAHAHMGTNLGIEITEIGPDFIKATMPVDDRTRQPLGLLHGGASCVLSESLGSIAAYMCIDPSTHSAVGQEINASHLRSVKSGTVTGICRPIKRGRRSHVWQTDIYDDQDNHICTSRLTVAITANKPAP